MRAILRRGIERIEGVFDAVFTPAWNPFYQLGALGWFFYWIVIASGIYLYVFFDTGTVDAYESVERITNTQWYAGGVMRSLHRYASDALLLVVLVHLVREYVLDRMRGPRWFAWVTGIPLIWMIYAAGITGYWMVWDMLAQYVGVATIEWLDTLPLFADTLSRNFLHTSTLSGRFFTLLVFIHIAVPLFMLFVMWLHIYRHSRPNVNPPRGLAFGSLAAMLVLSFVRPVYSQGPADLTVMPTQIELDWFYLAILPLSERVSGFALWVAVGLGTVLLAALPWLPPARKPVPARVELENCNGCGRCHDDCPYGAVTMGPRTDGSAYRQEAVVDPSLCVACGICTGSCPTATPFRRRSALVAGIEQPELPVAALRERCLEASDRLEGSERVMVFGCAQGLASASVDPGVATVSLPCIGMLPPSFIDFTLSRKLADGIVLTGCRDGDCHFRLGIDWTHGRVDAARDPHLRARVPRERVRRCFTAEGGAVDREIESLRSAIRQVDPEESTEVCARPRAVEAAQDA